jgi:CheY-like chemotaxis protein
MSEKNEISPPSYQNIYKTFVITVIALILSTQAITQYFIYTQKYDANRINIAGRQRMLSQNISKMILKIHLVKDAASSADFQKLETLKNLFVSSEKAILEGNKELGVEENNSELALSLFKDLNPHSESIVEIVDLLLRDKKIDESIIQNLFLHESEFLKTMDKIVVVYSQESITKTSRLQLIESILALFAVIVILLEIAILYRPLIQKLTEDNKELAEQKKSLEDFSFLLSHKVRKHVANLLGLMNTINPNNLLEIREYFQYVRQSVVELDTVSREFEDKSVTADSMVSINTVDSTKKYETFEKLRTIMLIDDDKITNILTKKLLLKHNPEMKVEVFSSPFDSIEHLEKIKADNWEFPIIFLDINMPQMNGWQFLDKIASQNMNPTIYILTSSIDKNDIDKARTYKNVKAFLTKPLTFEKMPTFV